MRGREAGCEAGRDQLAGPQRKRSHNSTAKFHAVDMYVALRMARLASIKHGLRGINWGQRFNYDWFQTLGVHRLAGTVGHRSAHA